MVFGVAQPISLASYFRLLRNNRNFRRLWLAQVISETGDWFYMVTLYAMLLEFTGAAVTLGIAFALQVAPQALTGPISGVINDRLPRRRVMIASDLARFVIVGSMLFVRSPSMVGLVYILLFSETVMWGLFEPARTALIPNVVATDDLMVANTISSATWSMNLFVGSALGGIVAVWLGRQAVFTLDAFSFLASALLIARIRVTEPHAERHGAVRLRDLFDYSPMLDGWRYVRARLHLAPAMLVKAGLGLAGASWVIFPILARDVFRFTETRGERAELISLSLLMGARGLGSLLGPLLAAPWAQQDKTRLRRGIVAAFLLYGAGYIGLARITSPWLAMPVIVFSHMGGAMAWVFSTTLLQLSTDDAFRGRIFSAELALCTTMLALTAYIAGVAMDAHIGVRVVLLATGLVTLSAAPLWWMTGMRAAD